MKYRTLGGGLEVSAIGIGCMPMVHGRNITYGIEATAKTSIETIHRAIDLGVTFYDTADICGPFQNEELVGQAIEGRREGLVIAPKFGFRFEDQQVVGVDSSRDNIRRACENSLQRLLLDCIDLFYQHRIDPEVPIEDVVGAMAELVQEREMRHLGFSKTAPETIRRVHGVHHECIAG